jgi:hypothetical protein
MTELDIYNSLIESLGVKYLDRDGAKAALLKRIKDEPGWLYMIPESLLSKLNIKYDHVYQQGDVALAAKIGGQCARRLL